LRLDREKKDTKTGLRSQLALAQCTASAQCCCWATRYHTCIINSSTQYHTCINSSLPHRFALCIVVDGVYLRSVGRPGGGCMSFIVHACMSFIVRIRGINAIRLFGSVPPISMHGYEHESVHVHGRVQEDPHIWLRPTHIHARVRARVCTWEGTRGSSHLAPSHPYACITSPWPWFPWVGTLASELTSELTSDRVSIRVNIRANIRVNIRVNIRANIR
jgi:hypothetical protein